jgi:hypothetical protein
MHPQPLRTKLKPDTAWIATWKDKLIHISSHLIKKVSHTKTDIKTMTKSLWSSGL